MTIVFIDRKTGEKKIEAIYGEKTLAYLYRPHWFNRRLVKLISRVPLFSHIYGWLQRRAFSKNKIVSFIQTYGIDSNEFMIPVNRFKSFNDFFCRVLKPESRPIAQGANLAIIPADGRYLVYPDLSKTEGFVIKGQRFFLSSLIQDDALAKEYENGSMVVGRLCPTDCHRFLFPCDGIPDDAHLINGYLYSVNPIALKQNIHILTQNKRFITTLTTPHFGKVLYLEIGATSVGSIHQVYHSHQMYHKGDEKGFFSFGGSTLILLFEPNRIRFDHDLIQNSAQFLETRCLMGETLGTTTKI